MGTRSVPVRTYRRRTELPVPDLVIGHPRSDGLSHIGAAVADAYPATVRTTAQAWGRNFLDHRYFSPHVSRSVHTFGQTCPAFPGPTSAWGAATRFSPSFGVCDLRE
jgi:hypothetical protein